MGGWPCGSYRRLQEATGGYRRLGPPRSHEKPKARIAPSKGVKRDECGLEQESSLVVLSEHSEVPRGCGEFGLR